MKKKILAGHSSVFVFFVILSTVLHFPLYSWASHFYFEKTPVPAIMKKTIDPPAFKYVPVEREVMVHKVARPKKAVARPLPEKKEMPASSLPREVKKAGQKKSSGSKAKSASSLKRDAKVEQKKSKKTIISRKVVSSDEAKSLQPSVENVDLSDDTVREAFMDYYEMLSSIIAKFAVYPEEARERRVEGVAYVSFEMLRSGQILEVVVKQSSGASSLDSAALYSIKNASPFPPLPVAVKEEKIRLNVPISFEIS